MKRSRRKTRLRRGMAMLMVLFIVMAIAVISAGFIARSDAALLCGYNYTQQNETDALAWGGLEHARAVVISPENSAPLESSWSAAGLQLEAGPLYYDLSIGVPDEESTDPNLPSTYTYPVSCTAYKVKNGHTTARSFLNASLFYDPNDTQAYYISIKRQ